MRPMHVQHARRGFLLHDIRVSPFAPSSRRHVNRSLAMMLLLVIAPSIAAQTSTAPIAVTAKVQSAVTLSGMVPLDFGAGIVPGSPATVTAANGGKIMVSYNVNTQLSLPNSVTLTRGGGGSVSVTLSCAQADDVPIANHRAKAVAVRDFQHWDIMGG